MVRFVGGVESLVRADLCRVPVGRTAAHPKGHLYPSPRDHHASVSDFFSCLHVRVLRRIEEVGCCSGSGRAAVTGRSVLSEVFSALAQSPLDDHLSFRE